MVKISKALLSAALPMFVYFKPPSPVAHLIQLYSNKPKSLTPAASAILALDLHLVVDVGPRTHLRMADIATIAVLLGVTPHAGTMTTDMAAGERLHDTTMILTVRRHAVRIALRHEAHHLWTTTRLRGAVGVDTDHAEAILTAHRLGEEGMRIRTQEQTDMIIEGRGPHLGGMPVDMRIGEGGIGELSPRVAFYNPTSGGVAVLWGSVLIISDLAPKCRQNVFG